MEEAHVKLERDNTVIEQAVEKLFDIIEDGRPFTDDEFPPVAQSIYCASD